MTLAELLNQHIANVEIVKVQDMDGQELEPWQPALGVKMNAEERILNARVAALEAEMTCFGASGLLITVEEVQP